MSKGRTAAALVLALALIASACARATPTPAPAPAPVATPTAPTPRVAAPTPRAAPRPAPAPAPAPVVKPTGELRIALAYFGVETLDPILGPVSGRAIYEPMHDWLVGFTSKGELSKDNGLAESWEMSPDRRTYTFKIRKGVKFHNGDEVTAEDVKFSLERVKGPRAVSSYAGTIRKYVGEMEVPDPYTLIIHTKEPYGFLAYDLSGVLGLEGIVVPKKHIQQVGEDAFAAHAVGTGPYKLVEQVVGSYIKYEAQDEHFWMGVPRFKWLTYFIVPEESTRIALLKTGQADIIEISRERAKELKGFNIFLKEGGDLVGQKFHNTWEADNPLSNKKVRQALALAINKEEMAEFIFAGQAKVSGNFPSGSWALGYEALPPYPYDPAQAKQLLTEAGYPDGFEVTLWSFPRAVSEGPLVVEATAGYFEKIGLKTKIITTEYGNYRTKWKKGQLSGGQLGWHAIGNRPLVHGLFRIIHHSEGMLTLTKIPELDRLIESIETAATVEEYGERARATQKYIHDNYLTIPIVETGALYATNDKVTKWNVGQIMYGTNIWDVLRR